MLKGVQKIQKIVEVAYKLVNIFKVVHCSKRTYNDLKLQNVMINTNGNLDADPQVYLIDFGFAKKYTKKDNKTHEEESASVEVFEGNQIFATVHQMKFGVTSRRDDLISLFYVLIYMLNDCNLWVGYDPFEGKGLDGVTAYFDAIKKWKLDNDLLRIADLLSS